MYKVILVLPAYNEARSIGAIIHESRSRVDEVLVVDDGSTDDTAEYAVHAGAEVLSHRINLGKAAALKTGCEAAVLLGADIIILMDSDGQHRPLDIPRVIRPLQEQKEVDVVVAGRRGGQDMPLIRNLGNQAIRLAVRLLFGVAIRDILSGFRAFRASVYPQLRWDAKRYQVETEMTVRIGIAHLRYQEIPIETVYHDSYKGMSIVDGIKILGNVIVWRFTL